MVRLSLSTYIAAAPEDVFRHVTAFGEEGPLSDEAFRAKHGNVLSREGSTFLTREVEGDDEVRWRCTFQYPELRSMEALDSSWSSRTDTFQPRRGGTTWTIHWTNGSMGVKGIAQHLAFRLPGHRRVRRAIVEPVTRHFKDPGVHKAGPEC